LPYKYPSKTRAQTTTTVRILYLPEKGFKVIVKNPGPEDQVFKVEINILIRDFENSRPLPRFTRTYLKNKISIQGAS
jgi:hypothetical protein